MLTKNQVQENQYTIKNSDVNAFIYGTRNKDVHNTNDNGKDISFHLNLETKTTCETPKDKDKVLEDIQTKLQGYYPESRNHTPISP